MDFHIQLDSFICIYQNLNSFNSFLILDCYLIFTKHEPVLVPAESSFPVVRWERFRLDLDFYLEMWWWTNETNREECSKTKHAPGQKPMLSMFYCSKAKAQLAPLRFFFCPWEMQVLAKDWKYSHITEGNMTPLILWLFCELL